MFENIRNQEQIIREAKLFGNGAHIFVPKAWIGQDVVLIRRHESLKEKIINILTPYLDNIIGVYLYGSNARGEAESNSDVDLFIITNKKSKMKKEGFGIISLKESEIEKAVEQEPLLIYSVLQEAKTIINPSLLEKLRDRYRITKRDVKEFVKSTTEMVKKEEELIKLDERTDGIASSELIYSLILRLRGIFIIKCLLSNKIYSHLNFKNWIVDSGIEKDIYDKAYKAYKLVKVGDKYKKNINILEARKILDLLKKEIAKFKR